MRLRRSAVVLTIVGSVHTLGCGSAPTLDAPRGAAGANGAASGLPGAAPVVLNGSRAEAAKKDELDPALAGALIQLRSAFESGDDLRAVVIARMVRGMKPDRDVLGYVDVFMKLVDGRRLQKSMESAARIEPVRDEATLGDALEFRLVLQNPGLEELQHPVSIPKDVGGGLFSGRGRAKTQLSATVTTVDFDAYGAESTSTQTIPIRVQDDIYIESGGGYSMTFKIEGAAPRGIVARRFSVAAEILPAEVRLDGRPVVLTRIACAPATTLALPSGYDALATDPVASLRGLLGRTDLPADRWIVPAALLVPRDARSDAVTLLRRALTSILLDGDRAELRARAVMAALRELTGNRDLGLDLASWIGWANRSR